MARNRVPVERKRKLGNPSHAKPLPPVKYVAEQVSGIPNPLAELGPAGRATWDRLWTSGATWISGNTDIEWAQLLCECVDERAELRKQVFAEREWRDRVGLRDLPFGRNQPLAHQARDAGGEFFQVLWVEGQIVSPVPGNGVASSLF